MVPGTRRHGLTVVVATRLEERAVRRALGPSATIVRAGVGLSRRPTFGDAEIVVSCGLAGGTRRDLPTGTVLVPFEVGAADGPRRACDADVAYALVAGARRLGIEPVTSPLASATAIVRGGARERYAALGFAAVDMETAFVDAPRIAAVRVILDTPLRELSEAWISPLRALRTPAAWRELPWLAREGPRCADVAARVLAAAFPK
jgi:hypothetical protein